MLERDHYECGNLDLLRFYPVIYHAPWSTSFWFGLIEFPTFAQWQAHVEQTPILYEQIGYYINAMLHLRDLKSKIYSSALEYMRRFNDPERKKPVDESLLPEVLEVIDRHEAMLRHQSLARMVELGCGRMGAVRDRHDNAVAGPSGLCASAHAQRSTDSELPTAALDADFDAVEGEVDLVMERHVQLALTRIVRDLFNCNNRNKLQMTYILQHHFPNFWDDARNNSLRSKDLAKLRQCAGYGQVIASHLQAIIGTAPLRIGPPVQFIPGFILDAETPRPFELVAQLLLDFAKCLAGVYNNTFSDYRISIPVYDCTSSPREIEHVRGLVDRIMAETMGDVVQNPLPLVEHHPPLPRGIIVRMFFIDQQLSPASPQPEVEPQIVYMEPDEIRVLGNNEEVIVIAYSLLGSAPPTQDAANQQDAQQHEEERMATVLESEQENVTEDEDQEEAAIQVAERRLRRRRRRRRRRTPSFDVNDFVLRRSKRHFK